jgi:hypothetical protein
MKALILAITTVGCLDAYAQSGFFYKSIDLANPTNAQWIHPPSESIGAILLDAHLKGKIKAYKFDVAHDVAKYAPIPEDELPDKWSAVVDYYEGDLVSYKGTAYMSLNDHVAKATTPDVADNWTKHEMLGTPISYHHHFPALADTTTKSQLISRMIETVPGTYDPWSETMEYFTDDRVYYNDKTWRAIGYNFTAIAPGTNDKYWAELTQNFQLFQAPDLSLVKILYHYKMAGKDTILSPQMLSLRVMDPYREVYRDVGLNFYYNDVEKLLQSGLQPLLYNSEICRLEGGSFILDEHTRINLTKWLQTKLISKEIKYAKKSVLNAPEFALFLATKPDEINISTWYVVQDPFSHDLTLIAGKTNTDYDFYTIPVLNIPYASIEPLVNTLPVSDNLYTFTTWLPKKFLQHTIELVPMDSIEAIPYVKTMPNDFSIRYFDEMHFDNIDSNPQLAAAPTLWKFLLDGVNRKTIAIQPEQSYYPCDYNWTGTTLEWSMGTITIGDGVSISHQVGDLIELPKPHMKLRQVGVIYRIHPSEDVFGKFTPLQVVFSFEDQPHTDLIDYRFNWDDITKVTEGRKEFVEIITNMKKALIVFNQTSIAYNIVVR